MNNSTAYNNFIISRKFNPYRGLGNACPVCGSSSGRCKSQEYDLRSKTGKVLPTIKTLCMTGVGGYGNPEYHYFNDTRDGQWGIYIPLMDWNEHRGENYQATPLEKEEWIKNQQLKQQALLDAENQRRAESLPANERDIAARAILAQLSLNEIDRKDLLRRGFTSQQIKDIGFRSIDKFQKLRESVNPRFPGVGIQGDRLNNRSIGGILIPIYTVTGEIVGFQIRNREPGKDRYRWLSSAWEWGRTGGSAPNLSNGELPLTFIYPQLLGAEMGEREVSLAEGTGAKPNIAAIKLGQQVIGAAGGQFLSSSEQLENALRCWRGATINLLLDGDDRDKPQVIRRWVNLYNHLVERGYKPRLMWSGKDIDELDDITDLRELTLDELGQKSGLKLAPVLDSTIIPLARKLYNESQKFTPNSIQCNRYFQWSIPELIENALIALKSALGTGKTEILKSLAPWAKERGYKLIFVGYRNNLLRQTCDRIPELYHVGDEDKIMLLSDEHLALCHHSAGVLDADQMENVILVFDECVSDLRDMITSKLTGGRNPDGTDSRQTRLAHIQRLIENCYAVVALDGYLSDTEVTFLQGLRKFDSVHKIENTYKNKMDVRMVDKKSTAIREVVDLAIADQGRILVTATTQKLCENLEKSLIRAGVPAIEIHRFDGTTDRSEKSIAFFDNPGEYLNQHKPRVLILSPTAESGISIDLKEYFITHYHFHLGNLGILSGLQFLGRYRDFSAPRVIYCEERGMIDEGNSSSFSKYVKDGFDYKVQIDITLLQSLLSNGLTFEATELLKTYSEQENSWLKLAHKYKSIHNFEMQHLKEVFVDRMRDEGYTVTSDSDDDLGCADTEDLMGAVELERQVIRSTRLFNSPNIDKQVYEVIKNNITANENDRLAASKYYTTQVQLPGIADTKSWSPELVQMIKFTHPQLIKQFENYHYLINPGMAETNHIASWLPVIETKSVWMPDQTDRSRLALTNAGRELGIQNLSNETISQDEIDRIATAVTESKLYQSAFKIYINPNKPQDSFKLCRRICKKFGIELKKSGDIYKVSLAVMKIAAFPCNPSYELLSAEMIDRIHDLQGTEHHSDSKYIQELGKDMEELGVVDKVGRMRLVAGAARYLGMTVISRRHRKLDQNSQPTVTRIYMFSKTQNPISDAIKHTTVRPGSHSVDFNEIYECVVKRLEQLCVKQSERIKAWEISKVVSLDQFILPIHTDDFASISKINLRDHQYGSEEFSIENLQNIAQSLLDAGQLKLSELKNLVIEYFSALNPEVLVIAAEMVQTKYPSVFERLMPVLMPL